jgi:hypothetical protein
MDATLYCRVLRRQAERVQPMGWSTLPAGAHARHHAHGVIAHMAHVDAAGQVWEHFKNIILGTRSTSLARNTPLLPEPLQRGSALAHRSALVVMIDAVVVSMTNEPKGVNLAGNDSVICRAPGMRKVRSIAERPPW